MDKSHKVKVALALLPLALGFVLGVGQSVLTTEEKYGEILDMRSTTAQYVACDPGDFNESCGTCMKFPPSTPGWNDYCELSSSRIRYGLPFRSVRPFSVQLVLNFFIFFLPLAFLSGFLLRGVRKPSGKTKP